MDLGITERWVYEYEDTMTIHLDRIMQHALSRHTLSIVTLRAIAVQEIWTELITNLASRIFHIPSQLIDQNPSKSRSLYRPPFMACFLFTLSKVLCNAVLISPLANVVRS